MSSITRFGIEFNIRSNQIYLDSATIGKMPISSIKAISDYYLDGGSVPVRGMHNEISQSNNFLEEKRGELANLFQVEPVQISFFPSRESNLTSILYSIEDIKDRRIITSVLEEHSVIGPAIRANNDHGTEIDYLNVKNETNLLESINQKVNSEQDILLLSSLTSTNGVKRDWSEIAKVCKDTGATFLLDISYSLGHEELNFKEISPDVVFASGCIGALGPPGTAFQITKKEFYDKMDPLIVGGNSIITLEEEYYLLTSSGSKFETGLVNCANISSMVNSLRILSNVGFSKIQDHESKLNNFLRKELENLPYIEINSVENVEYGPIISFGSNKIEAHDLAIVLEDLKDIQIRSGALCSHLFMYELPFNDILRVSTHLYNTEEEVKIFIETLSSVLSEMS